MNPAAQLEEYRRQMGADRVRRQMALDNRTTDGVCVTCAAGLGREHDPRCGFALHRKLAERVA